MHKIMGVRMWYLYMGKGYIFARWKGMIKKRRIK